MRRSRKKGRRRRRRRGRNSESEKYFLPKIRLNFTAGIRTPHFRSFFA
jgi:hypothetical protein